MSVERRSPGRANGQAGQLAFDFEAAERARDSGMAEADGHANKEWKDAALEAVYQTARDRRYLIVDDVWPRVQPEAETHDLRAMGPVMRRAVSLGYIAPTSRYQLSERISAHRNPRRIWESLVYENGL